MDKAKRNPQEETCAGCNRAVEFSDLVMTRRGFVCTKCARSRETIWAVWAAILIVAILSFPKWAEADTRRDVMAFDYAEQQAEKFDIPATLVAVDDAERHQLGWSWVNERRRKVGDRTIVEREYFIAINIDHMRWSPWWAVQNTIRHEFCHLEVFKRTGKTHDAQGLTHGVAWKRCARRNKVAYEHVELN